MSLSEPSSEPTSRIPASVPCPASLYDGLRAGSVSEIGPFLPWVGFLVFYHSRKQTRNWHNREAMLGCEHRLGFWVCWFVGLFVCF